MQKVIIPIQYPTNTCMAISEDRYELSNGRNFYAFFTDKLGNASHIASMKEGNPCFIKGADPEQLKRALSTDKSLSPPNWCFVQNKENKFLTVAQSIEGRYSVVLAQISVNPPTLKSPIDEHTLRDNPTAVISSLPSLGLVIEVGGAKNSYASFEEANKKAKEIQTKRGFPFAPYFLIPYTEK